MLQAEPRIDLRLSLMRIRVPANLVYRTFPGETVLLDLTTGEYHGLAPVAGDMLAALEQSRTALEAAKRLAAGRSQPLESVAVELLEFCDGLRERGLIELENAP